MKLAYLVDVHERFESVPQAMGAIGPVDVLVIGGDITTGGTPDAAAEAIEQWRPLAPRVLALAGNMDSPAIDARLVDLGVAINASGARIGDTGVFGVSASPRSPLNTPYELDDEELEVRMERGLDAVRDCRVKVFCPHAPPSDTACDRLPNGQHVGSAVIRAFIEREQPDVVLCGHIHESRGTDTIGITRIANPGPVMNGHYAVVEIGEQAAVRLDE